MVMNAMVMAVIVEAVALAALAAWLVRTWRVASGLKGRFAAVLDADREAARIRAAATQEKDEAQRVLAEIQSESTSLRQQYATARSRFEELQKAVKNLEENLEDIDLGLYRPHFTYADSNSYKTAIEAIRDQQKDLIKSGQAAICGATWIVRGDRREGERMVKQTQKLLLRAFNAESEAAVANISWNNYNVMEARIRKAFEALNKQGTTLEVSLTSAYLQLRLDELRLVFEAAEKKQQEREEQRQRRADQREEERAQRELTREQEDAAKEEARYQKLLNKAQEELTRARDAEREEMAARISQLEADLAAAHDRKERAVAQAQLTKVGHVYIISNVGALGEDVLKIGLTRRLDPEERVQELGDASVPFPFDVHAMIYSENAPELEARLQNHFWDRRLNWANNRKEFFRVRVSEVQEELRNLGLQTELLTVAEAKEYRQSLAAIEEKEQTAERIAAAPKPRFPEDPFAGSPGQETSAGTATP
jgi:hypothetical protein